MQRLSEQSLGAMRPAWEQRPRGVGWAHGRCQRSDLERISKIIYPTHLFCTKSLRPKEEKELAQGRSMG